MRRILAFQIILVLLTTCIDEHKPDLGPYSEVIVVEALLTNKSSDNYVKLSQTFNRTTDSITTLSGAKVEIEDDLGGRYLLRETTKGIYSIDSSLFKGKVGRAYTLHIKTLNGEEYISSPSLMKPVPSINKFYGDSATVVDDLNNREIRAYQIFIDSNPSSNEESEYLRWGYKEYWKFKANYSKFVDYHPDSGLFTSLKGVKTCWKNNNSHEILIHSFKDEQDCSIERKLVRTVVPFESDRFAWQYGIIAKQYSISKEEYLFWKKLDELGENSGNIFENQPYPISGNIRCVSDSEEPVIGFFSVSAVSEKVLFVLPEEISKLKLDMGSSGCSALAIVRNTPDTDYGMTILLKEMWKNDWYFVDNSFGSFGKPDGLIFSRRSCIDCSVIADSVPPYFWEEPYF